MAPEGKKRKRGAADAPEQQALKPVKKARVKATIRDADAEAAEETAPPATAKKGLRPVKKARVKETKRLSDVDPDAAEAAEAAEAAAEPAEEEGDTASAGIGRSVDLRFPSKADLGFEITPPIVRAACDRTADLEKVQELPQPDDETQNFRVRLTSQEDRRKLLRSDGAVLFKLHSPHGEDMWSKVNPGLRLRVQHSLPVANIVHIAGLPWRAEDSEIVRLASRYGDVVFLDRKEGAKWCVVGFATAKSAARAVSAEVVMLRSKTISVRRFDTSESQVGRNATLAAASEYLQELAVLNPYAAAKDGAAKGARKEAAAPKKEKAKKADAEGSKETKKKPAEDASEPEPKRRRKKKANQ
eukprot:TRINITY_DN9593_c0_g1_i1.p1 TRINITY_DN9593_c0_g1~~TRINITY_DN9593_c0_g1_i1.p1  ORF type:complete len:357 (+),score=112.66 TRINITY_DN9593_c0_g1_i1:55-1125(+)